MSLLMLSKYFFYFILFFIMSSLSEVLPMQWWKYFLNTTLGIKGRYWLLHAPSVLLTLWFCSPNEWWGWLVASCMVICLYDGVTGFKFWEKPLTTFLLHLHHLGPILAFIFQTEKLRYSSAIMYFSVWFCHLFGIIDSTILEPLGLNQNKFVKKMYKWVYTMINVYTCYWYTQQFQFSLYDPLSLALLSQVFGRFFINSNWKNILWMKCIELPGFTLVCLISAFDDMYYGVLAFLCASLIFVICNGIYDRIYPAKAFPEDPLILTDSIIKFLESYEVKPDMKESEDDIKKRSEWMQTMAFLKKYPLVEGICKSDLETVKKIVLSDDRSQYCYTIPEWYDSSPLGWAASTSELEMVILLLLNGANPWGKNAGNKCQIDHGYQHGRPFMKKFWDEFIELCPKKKKRNPGKVAREKIAKEEMEMQKKEY